MIQYLYWALFVAGFVAAYFAVKMYNDTTQLLNTGIKTKAVVKDLIEVSGDDGPTYKPVFEYVDRSNTTQEFKSGVSSRPPAYKIGEKVEVVYDPKDVEETKVVSFWGLYRWTIILLSIASPLLIIGGGYLLYARG